METETMSTNETPVLECEDCGEEIEPGQRRIRCKRCELLVCGWCHHHVHLLAADMGADCSEPEDTPNA
jgi:DNA-directed RNA polymerase subunit RPC12/RpoP